MSGFVFLREPNASDRARTVRARLAELEVAFDVTKSMPQGTLLFRSNRHLGGADQLEVGGNVFALFTGTFFFEGAFGREALQEFLKHFDPFRPSLRGTEGQFCLVLRKAEKLYLFTDRLGMNKVYCDSQRTVLSSLFLGVAESLRAPTIDRQGCYEYAWNGTTMGERTFYTEVRTLRAGHVATIDDHTTVSSLSSPELRERDPASIPANELVERHVDRGRVLFKMYARHFGDRINLSMSGGYDSRLLLAHFLEAGVRPHLFSYAQGRDTAELRLVQRIAEGERLPFLHVDKSRVPQPAPEAYADSFRRNFGLFDGWKVDGIFDTTSDGADRAARVADGLVKVNGSAGEIYRNFFYLKNRPIFARELVWSFFARYDPNACSSFFSVKPYEREIAKLIEQDVGSKGLLLERHQVELAYPLVRVRYWTARDVQLNQGFGLCLFPFLEPRLIRGTCDIPIPLKSYGRFEGRMIGRLNRRVASYRSNYGFGVAVDPPLSYRARAQLTYLRPPLLRRYLYRMKAREAERPYFLATQYLGKLMDPSFPAMGRYFRIEQLKDMTVLNRIATMEYHCQRHGARD